MKEAASRSKGAHKAMCRNDIEKDRKRRYKIVEIKQSFKSNEREGFRGVY